MNRFTIGTRLMIGFAFVSLLLMVVIGVGVSSEEERNPAQQRKPHQHAQQ